MKNQSTVISGKIEIIEQNPRLLTIIENVLEQNKMILEQNQILITTISYPLIRVNNNNIENIEKVLENK